jgi:hypothetical protein
MLWGQTGILGTCDSSERWNMTEEKVHGPVSTDWRPKWCWGLADAV